MRWLAGALAVALVALALGGAWLLGTQAGLQWAAARLQSATDGKLVLEKLHGSLAGEMRFGALRYADGETRIALDDGALRLELLSILGGRIGIRELRAETLDIALGEDRAAAAAPPSPPFAASLPLGVRIDRAHIARIAFRGHLLEDFRLRDALVREDGMVSALASFAAPHERYPAQMELRLAGSLERLELAAKGEVANVPVALKALVAPGTAQPLAALEAQAGPVDLSRLEKGWPATRISLHLRGKRGEAPLAGTLSLTNATPGPLDQQRIPVKSADARFSTDFSSLALEQLRVLLLGEGTLSGGGTVSAERAQLKLQAAGLNLRALRTGLSETRLAGRLQLTWEPKSQALQGKLGQKGMSLSADLLRVDDLVEIRSLRAAANGGVASGSGRLRLGDPLRMEADLELAGFDPSRFGEYPYGKLSGRVNARIALGKEPVIDAKWRIADSTLLGEAFSSQGTASVAGRRVTRADARAALGSARLAVRGDFGRVGDELALELEAPKLAQIADGISGGVKASGTVTGTWEAPRGRLRAQASRLRLPGGVLLASVRAQAEGTLGEHSAELHVDADDVDLDAQLHGGWSEGSGWSGELRSLRNAGRYPLELVAPSPLRLAPEAVELGKLAARLGEGRLLVHEARWLDGRLASSGEFTRLPAQWLLLAGGLTARLKASLLLDGSWHLQASPRLNGSVVLRRAAGDVTVLQDEPFALQLQEAAVKATFEEGRMRATGEVESKLATATLNGHIEPQAEAPGLGFTPQSEASFEAQVRFADLRALAQPLLTDVRVNGKIAAELQGRGTLGELQISGSLTGQAIGLGVPPYGIFMEDGELRATLEANALRIERFAIRAGDGRLTAQGTLPLRAGGTPAQLAWQAKNFRLLARPDLRLTVSGEGEAELVEKRVRLSGTLRADQGFLDLEQERLPQLGDDVVIVGEPRREPGERMRVPLALDLLLYLGDDLEVRGHGLEGELTGKLQLETTATGELRAYGRIETVNATFLAYGQRLDVDPGIATFDGPLDNPTLQMTAWRRNLPVEAGVQISGTARNPQVQIVSQPPVPEGERLSWLVLGRPPADATKADLGLLQAAAGALLSRGNRAPLDRRIARALGVDEISLRGSGEIAHRVVAVGKRLSDRLYVSYEQGLGTAASALVKLDFALTQRFSVRAETGTASGVGLFYRFSWD